MSNDAVNVNVGQWFCRTADCIGPHLTSSAGNSFILKLCQPLDDQARCGSFRQAFCRVHDSNVPNLATTVTLRDETLKRWAGDYCSTADFESLDRPANEHELATIQRWREFAGLQAPLWRA